MGDHRKTLVPKRTILMKVGCYPLNQTTFGRLSMLLLLIYLKKSLKNLLHFKAAQKTSFDRFCRWSKDNVAKLPYTIKTRMY